MRPEFPDPRRQSHPHSPTQPATCESLERARPEPAGAFPEARCGMKNLHGRTTLSGATRPTTFEAAERVWRLHSYCLSPTNTVGARR